MVGVRVEIGDGVGVKLGRGVEEEVGETIAVVGREEGVIVAVRRVREATTVGVACGAMDSIAR
jgi:hypothetical protein